MTFKHYLKEAGEISNLLSQVQAIQNKFVDSFSALENLKNSKIDDKASPILGNVNLQNQVDKIELEMTKVGMLLQQLQNVITGGSTVANTQGSWGGPE